jgi:copper chaperone CopZ
MTCQSCVNTAIRILKQIDGVDSVSVDLNSKQAIVIAYSKMTEKDLKTALDTKTNFEALFAGETLPQPLTEKEKEGLDIKTIKGGNKIKFTDHLAQGKIAIFDFYADWCSPCKVFSPKVERLLLEQNMLALRKVDVVDWKSNLAKQLTKKYKLPFLPFTLIFDDKGNLLGKVEGNNIEKVKKIIAPK